eukprot:g32584.t1
MYDMKSTDSVASQSFLSSFTEVLDDNMQERLNELTKALKSLEKNKTPGSDGLPAELYSVLLEVYDNMLLADYKNLSKKSKMDYVHRITTYKTLDGGCRVVGENVLNTAVILMATFVCGCIKLCVNPQYTNIKCHYLLRFYLSSMLRSIGLASLLWNTPSCWAVLHHLSFMVKFAKQNTFDHEFIRKWSAHSVLKTLTEKERVDPVRTHTKTNINYTWRTINSVKDALWSARYMLISQNKGLTPTEYCRLAHSKVQDY